MARCVTRAARILVVQDDALSAGLIREVLESEGHEVVLASDGAAALARLERDGGSAGGCSPDLILLDLLMPIMDGWSFARANSQLPGVRAPIVLVSAVPDLAAHAEELSARAFVPKPFDIDSFCAVVARLLTPPGSGSGGAGRGGLG